ncbi:MAG: glycosyltransferase [Phycisphaerae bacterium]|nr:glycosyltransferase [Phycisphaerae bacterium]
MNDDATIAVLLPCYNEEATLGKVIDDFRDQLPEARICVFDNCSTDASADIARLRGAEVFPEPRQGKGYVVESMLSRVEADICVMVDADDTYPAENVHELIAPVREGQADMAVGARLADFTDKSFRPLHLAGNRLVRGLINSIFKTKLTDILSGYRAFNRNVLRRVPVVSSGFEVETELTIQMLYYRLKIVEVTVPYRERPAESPSKLRTFRDGFRVLWKLFSLVRSFKPLTFFGSMGLACFSLGLLAGIVPVCDYIRHAYVYHIPLAILSMGLVLLAAGFVFLGLALHAVNWRFKELHNVLIRRNSHP